MAFAAVISVERTIEELINSPRISVSPPCKLMMEFAYQQLKSLHQILGRLDRSSKAYCRTKVNGVDERIKEAVWEFQDLIESHVDNQMLSQSDQILRYDVHLQELTPDVDDFTQKLKKMEEEYIYELHHMMPEEAPDNAVSATTDSDVRKVKLVGLSQILREIKRNLQLLYPFYSVISIVGMAGIGKTTVCKKIFSDSFKLGFECRAWVTIGRRKYPINELERDILVQLDPNMEKRLMEEDEKKKCSHYLKEILKAKRCLLVLDDVWDNYICGHFIRDLPPPPIANSHVLVTTRLRDVAFYILNNPVYRMQLLKKDESWDLLRERVFGENKCPRELEKYGKKIADKCDGLPLTIVTVANLLSQTHYTADYWKSAAEDKKSSIFMAAYDQMYEVLFPSYEYLPQHLKPCFLYMGVFPLNDEISKSNILRLWVVEGFLEPNGKRELEYSVEMYEIVTLPAPVSMFPLNLKKLHLSGLGYPWEFMSIIGSLPKLDVLKLRCYAFRGPKWEVKADEFKRLNYLLVEDTDLVQLKVESGGFLCLKSLCLKHCYKLEDIQWNGRTSYMIQIEVTDCSPSTEKFANKMSSIGKAKEAFVHSSLKDGKLK